MHATVDCGLWTVDRGLRTRDFGLWTLDFGPLPMPLYIRPTASRLPALPAPSPPPRARRDIASRPTPPRPAQSDSLESSPDDPAALNIPASHPPASALNPP